MPPKKKATTKVYVNVYDLTNNEVYYPLGLGFYHSGIEVNGTEYSFSSSGIFSSTPKEAPPAIFRESILLGETDFTYREIEQVIDALRPSFPGSKYHPMRLNCNNFSDALAKKLLKGKSIPPWINRMAMFGNMFSCLLPRDLNDPKTVGGDIGGGKTFSAFSGSGRTLTITSIPKQKKDQEDEEPLIDRRQKMLQATLNRLNASGKSDKEL